MICTLLAPGVRKLTLDTSPKPDIPPPSTYEAPEAPLRDLGPPPPGYGRYADFGQDRFGAGGGGGGGGGFGGSGGGGGGPAGAPRRNLDDVLCFKVRSGWGMRMLRQRLTRTAVWGEGALCEPVPQQERAREPRWAGPDHWQKVRWGRLRCCLLVCWLSSMLYGSRMRELYSLSYSHDVIIKLAHVLRPTLLKLCLISIDHISATWAGRRQSHSAGGLRDVTSLPTRC